MVYSQAAAPSLFNSSKRFFCSHPVPQKIYFLLILYLQFDQVQQNAFCSAFILLKGYLFIQVVGTTSCNYLTRYFFQSVFLFCAAFKHTQSLCLSSEWQRIIVSPLFVALAMFLKGFLYMSSQIKRNHLWKCILPSVYVLQLVPLDTQVGPKYAKLSVQDQYFSTVVT